jgi:heptosyltransferase-2
MSGRVVVLTPNWLGDAVMALPAIAAVRRHHAGARLAVAARASTAALFRMVAGVDEVVPLEAGGGWRGAAGAAADARALAAVGAEVAILLPNSFRCAWTAWRAGIPERWGFAADLRGRLLTRRVARPRGPRHQAEYYGALVAGLGMTGSDDLGGQAFLTLTRLSVPAEAADRAAALLSGRRVAEGAPLVGMAPGAAYGRAKQWPPERYAELARLLHERVGATSVLVGTRADRAAGAAIETDRGAGGGGWLVNLIGQTDLPLLAAVMERCGAFVANDSGAMHLAAAAGVPVTAPFGPTDERATAPLPCASSPAPPHEILTSQVWCRPCMLRECPIDHRCLTGIAAGAVADAVARQIGAR